MNIPAQLRLMRTVRGLTLAQVAEGTGVSLSYLSDLERGRTNPSIDTLEKIAEFYGLQLFISFVGDMPETVKVSRKKLEYMQRVIGVMLAEEPTE